MCVGRHDRLRCQSELVRTQLRSKATRDRLPKCFQRQLLANDAGGTGNDVFRSNAQFCSDHARNLAGDLYAALSRSHIGVFTVDNQGLGIPIRQPLTPNDDGSPAEQTLCERACRRGSGLVR